MLYYIKTKVMEIELFKTATLIKDPSIEPYFISKDSNSFTLWEACTTDENTKPKRGRKKVVTDDNKDKITYKSHGYYTQFGNCLNGIAKLKINHTKEYNSIKSYIKEYNRVKDELNQIINVGI
jgi:hypothetical protein